jgi:hypothetical protein
MNAEFNSCVYPNVTRANCTTEHICATFTHPGVANCLTEVQVQSIVRNIIESKKLDR